MTILNYSANVRNFLSYFGKMFDYGSQFSFSSGNINEGSASSEVLVLKGLALIKDFLLTTSILTHPGRCFPSQTPGLTVSLYIY